MDALPPHSPWVFEVSGLTYRYSPRDEAALLDASVKIPRGAITAVLGLSGSGKSTLLAILGRLIEFAAKKDQIKFNSLWQTSPTDYATLARGASNALRRDHFGFIMSSANMLGNFTCRTNIEMPLALQGVPVRERQRRLELLLDQLRSTGDKTECDKLIKRLDAYPNDVSTGQRQRMAVLRALIHDPEVVFADEPCNSLDPYNAQLFRELLRAWQCAKSESRSLVLVTHNAQEACRVASHIAIVERHGIGDLPVMPVAAFESPDKIEQRILDTGRMLAN